MEDDKVARAIGNAICKSVLYICFAVVVGMWVSDCRLDDSTIESCESACQGFNSHMESVTSSKCVCFKRDDITTSESTWVLPKSGAK